MMLSLARQSARASWRGYLGAFVALALGVALLSLSTTLVGATDATARQEGLTEAQRGQLDGLASMFGIMAAVSMFMAVFVVGSTFGFVVAARQRELGLLRLIGATPRQVRRLLLGESVVVAAVATVVGGLLGLLAVPVAFGLVRAIGVTDLHLQAPSPWIAWAVAAPSGMAVALLGARRSARRASRTSPTSALREAAVVPTRPSLGALVVAVTCFGTVLIPFLLASELPPLFALIASILLPEVAVVGILAIGPALVPRLAALLARPFAGRDVGARMARDELRAAARTTSAVAAPIVAISAIAGSLMLALSFTADWTSALNTAQLRAPLVVEGVEPSQAASLTADPQVAVADVRRQVGWQVVEEGGAGYPEQVEVVDPVSAAATRGLRATSGDLGELHGRAIAVTEGWVSESGTGLGDTVRVRIEGERIGLRVVAVVPEAPDLYGELLVATDAVPGVAGRPTGTVFVAPRPGVGPAALTEHLAEDLRGTPARVLSAQEWIEDTDARTRRSNDVGLVVLLGPAALYAGIAIINATLIGASQQRRQRRLLVLLGATRDQVRRASIWQAGLVSATGLLLGGTITVSLGWLIRTATTADLAGTGVAVPLTIPWLPLLATASTCLALGVLAALVGSRSARSEQRADETRGRTEPPVLA
ncbi:FtsX-like permease family protein [Nocardioides campestrisoli]|uniref:FtsX-like permease family protein n=1 Tax=Nocardioides campestrisoli TaxID=2736757 RepID=UPI00163D6C3B|nr:ABC transporter permease [Nocardioides campestrisoli]